MLTAATLAFVIVVERASGSAPRLGHRHPRRARLPGHGISAIPLRGDRGRAVYWRAPTCSGSCRSCSSAASAAACAETERFRSLDVSAVAPGGLGPLRELREPVPRACSRVALLALHGAAAQGAYQFTAQFLLGPPCVRQPGSTLCSSSPPGSSASSATSSRGRPGDRFGRRLVGCGFLSVFPVPAWAFVIAPGAWITLAWGWLVFSLTASTRHLMRRFATGSSPPPTGEPRPCGPRRWRRSDRRPRCAGQRDDAGQLRARPDPRARQLALLIGAAVILTFPETGSRELESISE